MSMLTLIQQATGEMGLSVPTYVAGNTNTDVVQQLALLNAVGYELSREFDWQKLATEYRFTVSSSSLSSTTTSGSAVITGISSTTGLDTTYLVTGTGIPTDTYIQSVDSSTQVTLTQAATASGAVTLNYNKAKYAMPADYDRLIDRTEWDKSKHWEMLGPETPQQWQFLKSGYIATGPRIRFRLMGGYFQIWPAVTTAEYLGFEYVSSNWATSVAGAGKSSFTVDTDTCVFPDRLMVLGLKAKYFMVKGFDASGFAAEYAAQKSIAKANDGGAKTLSFAPRISSVLIGVEQIPDTGYGS